MDWIGLDWNGLLSNSGLIGAGWGV